MIFVRTLFKLENKDLNQEIKDLKSQINSLNTTNQTDKNVEKESCSKYMEAEFYGEKVDSSHDMLEVLKLYNDGKYENYLENSGYYVSGTYVIENGMISLTVTGGGSMANQLELGRTNSYEITNNCSTINKNEDIKTLNRK